nr:DNA polymerase III subunit gamma and tau [Haematomicrobium sanguinis]
MSTALYRRYRPDTFQDVIGQDHVTVPLMTALEKNRVNHAYLFSGPRGCGKTTSARILARCLNCAQGPTPTPCGVCDSCVELARGGTGSLDVIEIDAASHGGVDDARDLRDRASFAPVRDRYKIFIIDEAHMVTSAGFNALLKIVEEPPEHIKFIFATTEPDKVIGTIRSRTHHYPFRLVPPEPLMEYMQSLSDQEGVTIAPGVLSLVVRAGGGSVRDSLSVLDQLIAGAGDNGVDYELAVSLLGFTHTALLDDVVDSLAAGDAATLFGSVDRVIQTGHDPRRFVEDLLERFRDLIIVRAMPENAEVILRGMPEDQLARLRTQAQQLGASELSRAADVTNRAFNEMTGATSPRLHLELLCARLMLPASDASASGVGTRLDQLERRLNYGGVPSGSAATPAPAPDSQRGSERGSEPVRGAEPERTSGAAPARNPDPAPAPASTWEPDSEAHGANSQPVTAVAAQNDTTEPDSPAPAENHVSAEVREHLADGDDGGERSEPLSVLSDEDEAAREETVVQAVSHPPVDGDTAGAPEPGQPQQSTPPAEQAPSNDGASSVELLRRAWPEIQETLKGIRRATWIMLSNATPVGFDGRTVELSFSDMGSANAFGGQHQENLQVAVKKVLGMDTVAKVAGSSGSSGRSTNQPVSGDPWGGGADPKVRSSTSSPLTGESGALGLGATSLGTSSPGTSSPDSPVSGSSNPGTPSPGASANPTPSQNSANAPATGTAPANSASPSSASASSASWTDTSWANESVASFDNRSAKPDWAQGESPTQPAPEPVKSTEEPEDVPSDDDLTLEESGLVGKAAIEKIFGARVIDERDLGTFD